MKILNLVPLLVVAAAMLSGCSTSPDISTLGQVTEESDERDALLKEAVGEYVKEAQRADSLHKDATALLSKVESLALAQTEASERAAALQKDLGEKASKVAELELALRDQQIGAANSVATVKAELVANLAKVVEERDALTKKLWESNLSAVELAELRDKQMQALEANRVEIARAKENLSEAGRVIAEHKGNSALLTEKLVGSTIRLVEAESLRDLAKLDLALTEGKLAKSKEEEVALREKIRSLTAVSVADANALQDKLLSSLIETERLKVVVGAKQEYDKRVLDTQKLEAELVAATASKEQDKQELLRLRGVVNGLTEERNKALDKAFHLAGELDSTQVKLERIAAVAPTAVAKAVVEKGESIEDVRAQFAIDLARLRSQDEEVIRTLKEQIVADKERLDALTLADKQKSELISSMSAAAAVQSKARAAAMYDSLNAAEPIERIAKRKAHKKNLRALEKDLTKMLTPGLR